MTKLVITIKKGTIILIGLFLFIFGIISLVLPLSPGIVLIALSISVSANVSDVIRENIWVKKFQQCLDSTINTLKQKVGSKI